MGKKRERSDHFSSIKFCHVVCDKLSHGLEMERSVREILSEISVGQFDLFATNKINCLKINVGNCLVRDGIS